jgi:signal transduction histidine kinase
MISILVVGIVASRHKYTAYLMVMVATNVIILFELVYYFPGLSKPIDRQDDIISHGLVFIACILIINYLIVQLKNSYHEEQMKVSKINEDLLIMNKEIQDQNTIIHEQNMKLKSYSEELEEKVAKRTELLSRLNEELKDQNNTLEQFTFMTAHNLRSPIAHIKGLINLLPTKIHSDPFSHETLQRLRESATNLDSVVGDITGILNIKKGDKKLEMVNIRKKLDLTLSTLQKEIDEKNVNLNISCHNDIKIAGVSSYFQSIFYNLIQNSIKYSSPERTPEITFKCEEGQNEIKIVIADNGIGFDMKTAENKVFQLYQRFNTEYQGKGYGLFLTKTQVEAMGGSIDVQSALGEGTEFVIKFPVGKPSI